MQSFRKLQPKAVGAFFTTAVITGSFIVQEKVLRKKEEQYQKKGIETQRHVFFPCNPDLIPMPLVYPKDDTMKSTSTPK
jgi:hypothetical protein